jgi:hypothetical protein
MKPMMMNNIIESTKKKSVRNVLSKWMADTGYKLTVFMWTVLNILSRAPFISTQNLITILLYLPAVTSGMICGRVDGDFEIEKRRQAF